MTNRALSDQCPVCSASLATEQVAFDQQSCPRCSADLWMLWFSAGPVFSVRRPGESIAEFIGALADRRLTVSAAEIRVLLDTGDSFDIVEFLLALEEAMRTGRP